MRLLVSVRDASEARTAMAGGADLIDAKDPRRGALGPVSPPQLRAICAAVGTGRPVSAALGDATDPNAIARAARAAAHAAYVKVGFRGIASAARIRVLAAAAQSGGGWEAGLILVAYADWRRAVGPPLGTVLEAAVVVGAVGVLVDTAFKDAGLFDVCSLETVGAWVTAIHAAGVLAAVAGSLRGSDLDTVRELGADIAGVRGAACDGGRAGRVSQARVAALSALARGAPVRERRAGALV